MYRGLGLLIRNPGPVCDRSWGHTVEGNVPDVEKAWTCVTSKGAVLWKGLFLLLKNLGPVSERPRGGMVKELVPAVRDHGPVIDRPRGHNSEGTEPSFEEY